jgi:hypothetical protein
VGSPLDDFGGADLPDVEPLPLPPPPARSGDGVPTLASSAGAARPGARRPDSAEAVPRLHTPSSAGNERLAPPEKRAAAPAPAAAPKRAPAPAPARRSSPGVGAPYGTSKPTSEGVIVARPAVIIGGSSRSSTAIPRPSAAAAPPPAAAPPVAAKAPPPDSIFGGNLISEKSLDEVILAYLSEDMTDK